MRSTISTTFELVGAAAVSAGAAGVTTPWVGLIVAGTFCLVFGFRMGNA